ncbi:MAG: hypothetical protein BGP25_02565 [Lysobacterales bacterium 63-13]|nr:MAG: hypothetical protein BGP25_02565 [Xanthomonadales bacterium 63-13]
MSERDAGSGSVASNVIYTAGGGIAIALVTVLTIPFYLLAIGRERYGVLVVFWTVVATLTLLELGVSGATTQRIASVSKDNPIERDRLFSSAMMMNAIMGLVGSLVAIFAIQFIATKLSFSTEAARVEFVACWPAMAAIFPIMTIRNIAQAAMVATHKFKPLAVICVAEAIAVAVVPLAVAWCLTIEVPALLASIVVIKGLTLVFMTGYYTRVTPQFTFQMPRMAIVKSLLGFGLWATVSSVITLIFVSLDRFLIAGKVGVAAIPLYSVPQSITQHLSIVPRAFTNVLYPRFSAASTTVDAMAMSVRAIDATNYLLVPVCVFAIIVIEPFLSLWVGADFAAGARVVAFAFIIGAWASGLGRIPGMMLYGRGLPGKVAKIHAIELLPFVVLLFFAVKFFGIVGAAIVVVGRMVVDTLLLARSAGLARLLLRLSRVPTIFLLAGTLLGLSLALDSPLRWMLAGGLSVATLAWFVLSMPSEMARLVTQYAPILRSVPFGKLSRPVPALD